MSENLTGVLAVRDDNVEEIAEFAEHFNCVSIKQKDNQYCFYSLWDDYLREIIAKYPKAVFLYEVMKESDDGMGYSLMIYKATGGQSKCLGESEYVETMDVYEDGDVVPIEEPEKLGLVDDPRFLTDEWWNE